METRSNNKQELIREDYNVCFERESKTLTYEQFCKNGGILQPIRAIVKKNASFNEIIEEVSDISIVHDRLQRSCDCECTAKVKEHWREYINQSNIIGYFSAEKTPCGIIIGFSYCKPEDWWKFDHDIAKQIAMNKLLNKAWIVDYEGNIRANEGQLWAIRKILTKMFNCYVSLHNDYSVAYLMLGSLHQQCMHFTNRVKRYYKIAQDMPDKK